MGLKPSTTASSDIVVVVVVVVVVEIPKGLFPRPLHNIVK